MQFRLLIPAVLALVLGACETTHGRREQPSWPYPEEPRPGQPGGTTAPSGPKPIPGEPSTIPSPQPGYVPPVRSLPSYPKIAEDISGGAVVSLLRQAREASNSGQPEKAQAALERALRIESRNYFVWSALANTYLEQKNYSQAISVAQKSNSLARGNIYAEMENYRVIALARDASGDAAGALQAQARVEEIQQMMQQAQPATSN